MSVRTDTLRLDAPFSHGLTHFFVDLQAIDWSTAAPSCLFIRDFEELPYRAPFDIDVLCTTNDWPELRHSILQCAQAHELYVAERAAPMALYILVLDLAGAPETRRHAFFEIRSHLNIPTSQFALPAMHAVDIAPDAVPRLSQPGLPVPDAGWHCAFLILQSLRKSPIEKYLDRINAFGDDVRSAAVGHLASQLGLSREILEQWLKAPTPKVGHTVKTPPKTNGGAHRRRALCADWLFFLPLLRLDFFSLHGPDGVGKSTTCAAIAQLFEGLPVGLYQFHHSEGWKNGRRSPTGSTETLVARHAPPQTTAASPLRRFVRTVYRLMPAILKELWLWNSHFVNYNRKFTRFLYDNRNRGNILFADRYVYDVRIKYIVETPHPRWLVRAYYRLHCALMPKPRFAFILIDEPAAIAARKNELSEAQISKFIEWIGRVLREHRVPHQVIAVAGRSPAAIAAEIGRSLLDRRGSDLIGDMRSFVSRLEAEDAHPPNEAPRRHELELRQAV